MSERTTGESGFLTPQNSTKVIFLLTVMQQKPPEELELPLYEAVTLNKVLTSAPSQWKLSRKSGLLQAPDSSEAVPTTCLLEPCQRKQDKTEDLSKTHSFITQYPKAPDFNFKKSVLYQKQKDFKLTEPTRKNANTDMKKMLELSGKDFKVVIIKDVLQANTDTLEISEKNQSLSQKKGNIKNNQMIILVLKI